MMGDDLLAVGFLIQPVDRRVDAAGKGFAIRAFERALQLQTMRGRQIRDREQDCAFIGRELGAGDG